MVAERPHAIHLRVRAGLSKPHNWLQLVKFCAVGASGYVVNLTVFALCVEVLDLHHLVAATLGVRRCGDEQLLVEPPLDVPRARRPRRLPGRSLLHGQRGGLPVRRARARAARERGGLPELAAQAISIVVATPLNFIGNKMWSFRIELSRD